jgi:hypothetical protein
MTLSPRTIECLLPGHRGRHGRPRPSNQPPAEPQPPRPTGRVPRVSRLMALALRFQGLLQQGLIADYATLARLGHVSRARITQIMNLAVLAQDIQETLLFLPRTQRGRDPLHLRYLQPLTRIADWGEQRKRWQAVLSNREPAPSR